MMMKKGYLIAKPDIGSLPWRLPAFSGAVRAVNSLALVGLVRPVG